MLNAKTVKEKAKELGATLCAIGKVYKDDDIQRDPMMILPNAKCIIGFGFAVPNGILMKKWLKYFFSKSAQ